MGDWKRCPWDHGSGSLSRHCILASMMSLVGMNIISKSYARVLRAVFCFSFYALYLFFLNSEIILKSPTILVEYLTENLLIYSIVWSYFLEKSINLLSVRKKFSVIFFVRITNKQKRTEQKLNPGSLIVTVLAQNWRKSKLLLNSELQTKHEVLLCSLCSIFARMKSTVVVHRDIQNKERNR